MQDVQATDVDAPVDCARTEPEIHQLTACDDAVLELREGGDRRVDPTP
jgi:hypothetical protein